MLAYMTQRTTPDHETNHATDSVPDDLVGPTKAAQRLGVHVATLYRWMERGKLRVYRMCGRNRRVSLAEVLGLVSADGRDQGGGQFGATRPATANERDRRRHRTQQILKEFGLA